MPGAYADGGCELEVSCGTEASGCGGPGYDAVGCDEPGYGSGAKPGYEGGRGRVLLEG